MFKICVRFLSAITAALILAACAAAPPPPVTAVPPVATASPVPSLTAAPDAPAPTRTRRPRPTPAPYLTPTPAGPLLSQGPWLVFNALYADPDNPDGRDAFSAMNKDGSGLTSLVEGDEEGHGFLASPLGSIASGIDLVYLGTALDAQGVRQDALKLLRLPDRTTKVAVLLGAPDGDTRSWGVVWSHDGRSIAYLHGSVKETQDPYIYSLDTHKVTRITHPGRYAFSVRWSPDDRYILYGTADSEWSDAPEPAHFTLWSSRSDGAGQPLEIQPDKPEPAFFGWRGSHTALIGYHGPFDESAVRQVDVATADSQVILEGDFHQAAYDPQDDRWLKSTCEMSTGGSVVLELTGPEPHQTISRQALACGYFHWLDKARLFIFYPDPMKCEAVLVSLDGQTQDIRRPNRGNFSIPTISPDGRYWAWAASDPFFFDPGLWISDAAGQNLRQIAGAKDGVGGLMWVPDGDTLFYGGDLGVYKASAPDFVPELLVTYQTKGSATVFGDAQWIP